MADGEQADGQRGSRVVADESANFCPDFLRRQPGGVVLRLSTTLSEVGKYCGWFRASAFRAPVRE